MSNRVQPEPGVNAFRFVLMFPIIMSHGWWFAGDDPSAAARRLLIAGQCSVPMFFITSGYLLRWWEGDRFAVARWALHKLLPLYVIWSLVYVAAAWGAGMLPPITLRSIILPGAITPHLWFLPALAIALAATSTSLRFLGPRRTWCLAAVLAASGFLAGTYLMALGMDGHPLRAKVLTAPLLVLIGVWLATVRLPRLPMLTILIGIVVLLAYCLQLAEDRVLATTAGYSADRRIGITLATIPYALAVFLFARSLPDLRPVQWFAKRKTYLLVIYCIHPIMLVLIGRVYHQRGFAAVVLVTALAYAMSAAAAVLFAAAQGRLREIRQMRHARLEVAASQGG